MNIHLLPADVAGKIAAGEVVERPANVAKELLENSLDAGAREIRVEIREGGQRLLRVIDDGHGIRADELPLALHRHATSKLRTADDLNRIATFGFRGEALYSIAAVSHLTLASRHREEQAGAQIRAEGGQVLSESAAGMPIGTIVTVEQIFFNTPARKKFLRKAATEAGHIAAIVQRYALAWPERRFSLVNDGRLLFQSTGSGDVTDVLAKIYGLENARLMVGIGRDRRVTTGQRGESRDEIDFRAGEERKRGRGEEGMLGIRVGGFVSLPVLTRANRGGIDLFVNRRYVEDRSLTHAVIQAYHTLLPVGRFPVGVVFVEMDPAAVDVNVHPRKTEVRFQEAREVFSAVQKAVRQVVIENAGVPGFALGPGAEAGSAEDAEGDGSEGWAMPGLPSGWAARRESILSAGQVQREMALFVPQPETPPPPLTPVTAAAVAPAPEVTSPEPPRRPSQEPAQPTRLPPLRVVGQVGAMYIVAEGPEGMFLIDQHAAHERVMYEKFMAQRMDGGGIPRQGLLNPLALHLGDALAGQVALYMPELAAVGFDVEPFGGDTWLVRSVPSVLAGQDAGRILEEIVQGLALERDLVREEVEARLVKMVCKRASIKAGQTLSDIEMKELIRQLEACQSPRTCPHGRPTMLQLSSGELEKAFKRT